VAQSDAKWAARDAAKDFVMTKPFSPSYTGWYKDFEEDRVSLYADGAELAFLKDDFLHVYDKEKALQALPGLFRDFQEQGRRYMEAYSAWKQRVTDLRFTVLCLGIGYLIPIIIIFYLVTRSG
jgi:hypothetical protein